MSSKFLETLFRFLKNHRIHNERTQNRFYQQILGAWTEPSERISALLYAIAKTRGGSGLGRLNEMADNWKSFHRSNSFANFGSINDLALSIAEALPPSKRPKHNAQKPLDSLFLALKALSGFGDKTAALFVKALVEVHTSPHTTDLRFITDFRIEADDVIRVPVDAVIKFIFDQTIQKNSTFAKINQAIFELKGFKNIDALIWDDLWFWGFITQHGGGKDRQLMLNMPKFWVIHESPKCEWQKIESKAKEFIGIIKSQQDVFNSAASRSS